MRPVDHDTFQRLAGVGLFLSRWESPQNRRRLSGGGVARRDLRVVGHVVGDDDDAVLKEVIEEGNLALDVHLMGGDDNAGSGSPVASATHAPSRTAPTAS